MDRKWLYKFLLVVGLAAGALYQLWPTVIYFQLPPETRNDDEVFTAAVPDWLPQKHLTLGLDLQGGIHLVMGVEVDKAVMGRVQRRGQEIRRYAEEKGVEVTKAKASRTDPELVVELAADAAEKFRSVVLDQYDDMIVVSETPGRFVLAFTPDTIESIKTNAVDQAVKTIRNRVDQWGVSEPQIVKRGEAQILIQLPGVKDPDRAKDLLGKTAQLEFRIVEDHKTGFIKAHSGEWPEGVSLESEKGAGPDGEVIAWYLTAAERKPLEAARDQLEDELEEGVVLAFQRIEAADGTATYRTYVLTDTPGITGDHLIDAGVALDQQRGGRPYVSFEFNKTGARVFGDMTEANIGRRMAVVLDDSVESAPVIQSKISARGQITLGSLKSNQEMYREANDLALVLKAGALPAPVRILEERTVGASLGPDLVKRGFTALMIGGLLVLLFMPIYYRAAGLVADVALVLNVLFLAAILATFGATLTLPGIAGVVLTVGMAVDANVIIFERIREEVALGKTVRTAIDSGYQKAFSAILDGNVTTGIAAFVLLQYGTGPIRGFAVTLMAGIVSTLFTAVFASRVMMDAIHRSKSGTVSV